LVTFHDPPRSIPRCSLIFSDLTRLSDPRHYRDFLDVGRSPGGFWQKAW
jgi:hypothetical protein